LQRSLETTAVMCGFLVRAAEGVSRFRVVEGQLFRV